MTVVLTQGARYCMHLKGFNLLNHARLRHPSYCDLAVKTMWIVAQHHAAMTSAFPFTLPPSHFTLSFMRAIAYVGGEIAQFY